MDIDATDPLYAMAYAAGALSCIRKDADKALTEHQRATIERVIDILERACGLKTEPADV
jgi:hypothetical protein